MSTEEEVLRRRLLSIQATRDVDQALKSMYTWLQTGDITNDQSKMEQLLLNFQRCEFEASNQLNLSTVYIRETEEYENLYRNIDEKISLTLEDKARLLDRLAAAQKIRSHWEQYDALAEVALKYPARVETEDKIKMVNEDTTRLERRKVDLDSKLDIHQKDFLALTYVVKSLVDHLGPDDQ